MPDGTCVIDSNECCCKLRGGFYQPNETICGPMEACCLPDASCTAPVVNACCPRTPFNGFVVPVCLGDPDGDGADNACLAPIVQGCCWECVESSYFCAVTTQVDCIVSFPGRAWVQGGVCETSMCGFPCPFCGDGVVNQPTEACDRTDDAACRYECRPDCTCPPPPVCGNNIREGDEECDGTDVGACTRGCRSDCRCQGYVVGGEIPTVSEWGLIVLTLLGMVLGTIMLARRRSTRAAGAA